MNIHAVAAAGAGSRISAAVVAAEEAAADKEIITAAAAEEAAVDKEIITTAAEMAAAETAVTMARDRKEEAGSLRNAISTNLDLYFEHRVPPMLFLFGEVLLNLKI